MKILMVSIFSPHFFNWTEQLKDSGHEIYWLDVFDSNTHVQKIDFVHQITGWRYRWDFPGRYFIKEKFPFIYNFINKYNERKIGFFFEDQLLKIKPDVVHSFALHLACTPILSVMKNNPQIKWIYSSWGSDIFLHEKYTPEIEKIMPYVNYIFTDCLRDITIARNKGFNGEYLGNFPGPGGYNLDSYKDFISSFEDKKLIAVKGYQDNLGRCIPVILALMKLPEYLLKDYQVVIFGASQEVKQFVLDQNLHHKIDIIVYGRLPHTEVMKILGRTLLYVGNSISDGIPNTLLESIVMEACPIHSNPGGASSEIITNSENGFLINNPDDSEEISSILKMALEKPSNLRKIIALNNKKIKPRFDRNRIALHVNQKYAFIEKELQLRL